MREVRREADRVLYTYVVGGRTLQAVVMRHGRVAPGMGAGADGIAWHVESWARCDVVEFPDHLAEREGAEVWTDASGARISTMTLYSWTSDGDCLAPGLRMLRVGEGSGRAREYLAHAEAYPRATEERFQADVPLPDAAVDSGYGHDGGHLWFAADGHRAYVGTAEHTEVWPRATEVLGCG